MTQPEQSVYVVTCGVGDLSNDPQREIVGVYSTVELAEAAMLKEAPSSGSVERYLIDGETFASETLMWREWDYTLSGSATRRING